MYWVFLAIFILIVFVPDIIIGDILYVNEEVAEEMAIFLLGVFAVMIFIYKDKQFKFSIQEMMKIKREFNNTFQDLSNSYSYIGEMNRKIEILRSVSLKLVNLSNATEQDCRNAFKDIRDAIRVLAKTDKFNLVFFDFKEKIILEKMFDKESSLRKAMPEVEKLIMVDGKRITKTREFVVVRSSHDIENFSAFVTFQYNGATLPEDVELIQMIVTQALFLFVASKKSQFFKLPVYSSFDELKKK